jgi:RNA-binding protein
MSAAPKGAFLRDLKARAQRLEPVVKLCRSGASDAFYAALHAALDHHELVKIRFEEFKDQKKALAPQIAERSASHIILRVGNVLVLYKPQLDPESGRIKV